MGQVFINRQQQWPSFSRDCPKTPIAFPLPPLFLFSVLLSTANVFFFLVSSPLFFFFFCDAVPLNWVFKWPLIFFYYTGIFFFSRPSRISFSCCRIFNSVLYISPNPLTMESHVLYFCRYVRFIFLIKLYIRTGSLPIFYLARNMILS